MKKKFDAGTVIAFIVMLLYSLFVLYMLIFCILTALKSQHDFTSLKNYFGLPKWGEFVYLSGPLGDLTTTFRPFDNLKVAWVEMSRMLQMGKGASRRTASVVHLFLFSLLYAGGSMFVGLFSKLLVAYFCSKYDTRLGRILYAVAVITMILPIVGATASAVQLMRALNIYDTYYGILWYNASYHGAYFLVFYAAFKGIPDSYGEAARIDGAGHFAVLFKIYIPMVIPSMYAIGIMQFITFWNEYQTPMLFLNSMPTIAYGLYYYEADTRFVIPTAKFAAALLVCAPVIVLFVVFRNKILSNVTEGGLKG